MKLSHLALSALMFAAACGGSSGTAGGSATSPVAPVATAVPTPSATGAATADGPVTAVLEINASNRGGAFDPEMVKIPVGGTVLWTNRSGNIHNVTFTDPGIKASGVMMAGDTFKLTFSRAGTYTYTCTYHPGMNGTVVVG